MKVETLAVHAGRTIGPGDPVSNPIVLSTVFQKSADGSLPSGHLYTRLGNPNRESLEACLAELEGGAVAAAFASGSAASMAVFHGLSHGDHVIAPQDVYHGTRMLLDKLYTRWGLQISYVDLTDLTAVRSATMDNTRLVWIETPSNPLLTVTDIEAVTRVAHEAGALVAVDNTWPTPLVQRPLTLGADVSVHSTTKYLGGHSDLLGGCVVAKSPDGIFEHVREFQTKGGGVPSPFDCWLLRRSIATLPYRMRAHCDNARRIAQELSQHPKIETVHYPGLPQHPQHSIAKRQMADSGGMLSFEVRGGREAAFAVVSRVQLIAHATSLGGVESLIEHRASVEDPTTSTPENLLRLSVGIENVEDILADLIHALG